MSCTKISFTGLVGSKEISNSKTWVDPIVGIKGLLGVRDTKFQLSGFFMIGGYGAGSDLMWDANINLS